MEKIYNEILLELREIKTQGMNLKGDIKEVQNDCKFLKNALQEALVDAENLSRRQEELFEMQEATKKSIEAIVAAESKNLIFMKENKTNHQNLEEELHIVQKNQEQILYLEENNVLKARAKFLEVNNGLEKNRESLDKLEENFSKALGELEKTIYRIKD